MLGDLTINIDDCGGLGMRIERDPLAVPKQQPIRLSQEEWAKLRQQALKKHKEKE